MIRSEGYLRNESEKGGLWALIDRVKDCERNARRQNHAAGRLFGVNGCEIYGECRHEHAGTTDTAKYPVSSGRR